MPRFSDRRLGDVLLRTIRAARIGDRLQAAIAEVGLDRGVWHMDLTPENVHRVGDRLTVFDFDSAGDCWRAIEPYGVAPLSQLL
jgi:Ser/Thr protein kinase RdoA (MazF antagonist)